MTYAAYQHLCRTFGIMPMQQAYKQLCAYVDLLCKWGKSYNLTARPTPQAVWQHIVDCLPAIACAPSHARRCLDIGSGAGFPGIVFAVMRPEMHITLLDSNGKKTRFLERVVYELHLSVTVVCQRLEIFSQSGVHDNQYDMISSRAFATLADSVTWMSQLLTPRTLFVAIKGLDIDHELTELAELERPLSVTVYPACEQAPRTHIVCLRPVR